MISRRMMMAGVALLAAGRAHAGATPPLDGQALADAIAAIERDSRGRLGVAVLDTGTGRRIAHAGDRRFAMCSTFKFLLSAAVLRRVDAGAESLDRELPIASSDIIGNSPVTKRLIGGSASIAALCEAAVTTSDNGAANLLLATIGGPRGLTGFAREIGDTITRLDRSEPDLNEADPDDPRDTTSPDAMLDDMNRLLLGSVLKQDTRNQLAQWLIDCRTGAERLRKGLPQGWRAGDKTGTGENGTANDIAIVWPDEAAPILIVSYLTGCPLDSSGKNAVHAAVARAIVAALRY